MHQSPLLASGILLVSGCIDVLEGLPFSGNPTDAYTFPHNDVREDLIEQVELQGTVVAGEDEAPTLAGIWAHQCDESGSCMSVDAEEFRAARQGTTILYFHGNYNHLDTYWDRVQILWRMGYEVFAIDYRGYGMSTGSPSEEGIYADGRTALAHVKDRLLGRDPSLADDEGNVTAAAADLVFWGFSLGSTVAVQLSVEDPPEFLVMEAALASTQGFVDDATSAGLSSSILLDGQLDNVGKIPFVTSPKLITHGEEDDFVRFEFGELLFERAREPKFFLPVAGADHSNVPCPSHDPDVPSIEVPCIAEAPWIDAVTLTLDDELL
jgi:fermentation-respiration switch protein FrsA (DUF1100 family)